MLDRIEFMLAEGFTALRRNLWMSFAAISTASVALFLLGGLVYVYFRVNSYAAELSNKFEMRVWLKEKIDEPRAKAMIPKMKEMDGVRGVVFVPRDTEWAKWKANQPQFTEGWDNYLPHSFRVTLKEIDKADQVAKTISKMPEVEVQPRGVVYLRDEQQIMDQVMGVLRWVGGALGALLLITAGILIYNAIKLTIFARRREIRIMQLVGASAWAVRTPFMIEGAVQGAVGGFCAASLIALSQAGFQRVLDVVNKNQLQLPGLPFAPWALFLLLAGGAFGAACSFWAIREPLRYKSGVSL